MMLPDGNLLIAFKHSEHVDHQKAVNFFAQHPQVATCPITELNLVRVLMQLNYSGGLADALLKNFIDKHRARLIPADISATATKGVCEGHRVTTAAYLAKLAKTHELTPATMDGPMAQKFSDVAQLV